jgi:hypothetical protein
MEHLEHRPIRTGGDIATAKVALKIARGIWAKRGQDAIVTISYATPTQPAAIEVRRRRRLAELERLMASRRERLSGQP